MFRTLAALVPKDKDLPERAWSNDVLARFLDDSIYDVLAYDFHQEYTDSNEYIPIAKRAPSVRYQLCKVVVSDSVSFLFSENHFPEIDCGDNGEEAEDTFAAIIKDTRLNETMLDAATRGSVGSACVWVRVLGSRLFFKALSTTYLTPTFKPDAPDTLAKVTEQYKVKGSVLREQGYAVADDELMSDWWFRREWDDKAETWFLPWRVKDDDATLKIDKAKTVKHNLGFVPMVWVLNLPGGDDVDGSCTFKGAVENSIEINYQLSQAGRGLKYSSSPTLVIKQDNPQAAQTKVVGDALIVPTEGDAKLLEIGGDAAKAVVEYTREIRKLALESIGGSRADADKLSAATSGRAMEMMNQSLIWLADKLRISYGEGALLKVLKMVAALSRTMKLVDSDGAPIKPIPEGVKITLKWPSYYAPTSTDRNEDANALNILTGANIMSQETATKAIAAVYDIEDTDAERALIAGEVADAQAAQMALAAAKPKPVVNKN